MERTALANGGLGGPHRPRHFRREQVIPEDLSTIDELLSWVGADPDRAEVVLAAENAKSGPRKTLVQQLTDIILEA